MKLKELRKAKKLTQEDIAKILNVAKSTYCGYEKGTSEPTLDTLCKLADFYNVNLDYLIGRKNNIENFYSIEQKQTIEMLLKLDNIYLSMVNKYIEKLLQDQLQISKLKIENNKQWN